LRKRKTAANKCIGVYGGATKSNQLCCKHQQLFQRDEQHLTEVLIINIVNFIQQRCGAGSSMNTVTSPMLQHCVSPVRRDAVLKFIKTKIISIADDFIRFKSTTSEVFISKGSVSSIK
jgi:hypothetical protein